MGISGLLPFVSSASAEAHVSRFKGQRLAVDASCWLHRGAIACARDLAQGEPTEAFLNFPMRMVALLQEHGVVPLLVFDGAKLPMKARTDARRQEDRARQRQLGDALHAQGKHKEATTAYNRAVSVTTAMARQLINRLRERDLPFIVAPYEADAQLAFLVLNGHCTAAISEDSDLLAYGCPHVLYKLDRTGHGRLISHENLQSVEQKGLRLFDGAWPDEWRHWREVPSLPLNPTLYTPRTPTHLHPHARIRTHTCAFTRTHPHPCVSTRTHPHPQMRIHTHTRAHPHTNSLRLPKRLRVCPRTRHLTRTRLRPAASVHGNVHSRRVRLPLRHPWGGGEDGSRRAQAAPQRRTRRSLAAER